MTATLYERLGGAQGIAGLVDDVIDAHLVNPVVKTRFENIKDLDHARKMAREFFCAGAGGPEPYTGRDMLAAHKGMNISEQEYLAVTDDIVGAMEKNGISEDAKKDVIAILYSLKGSIIRV
jgi:hemoglobin